MVHVIRFLLASGAAGINRVPVRMAFPAAISDRGRRSPRRTGPRSRIDNAAAAIAERPFSDRKNLRIPACEATLSLRAVPLQKGPKRCAAMAVLRFLLRS